MKSMTVLLALVVVLCGTAEAKDIPTIDHYKVKLSVPYYTPFDIFKVCIDGRQFLVSNGSITQVFKYQGMIGVVPAPCYGEKK